MLPRRRALFLALLALSLRGARAATLVVVNRLPKAINVLEPRKSLLEAGRVSTVRGLGDETSFGGKHQSHFGWCLPTSLNPTRRRREGSCNCRPHF